MKELHVDELLELRRGARAVKDYRMSDQLRDELDSRGVFVFDAPDGNGGEFQEVHYPPPGPSANRKAVELRMQRDSRANRQFDAWLTSNRCT